MGKKNLDEFFQEKFQDFSEVPDERVWHSIENSLQKKKKKVAIPLWWKLSGAAAVLLMALLLFNPFAPTLPENQIISNSTTNKPTTEEDREKNITDKDAPIRTHDTPQVTNNQNTEMHKSNPSSSESNSVVHKNDYNAAIGNSSSHVSGTVGTTMATEENMASPSEASGQNSESETETAVATVIPNEYPKDYGAKSALPSIQNEVPSANDSIGNNPLDGALSSTATPKEKISILDAIDEEETELPVEESSTKWSAGPTVAPVYFNGIGQGSSINPIFVPNSKSGDVNFSYGFSVAYEVSKKLKVRSGVNKVAYGYTTNDVSFASSFDANDAGQIDKINYAQSAKNLVIASSVGSQINSALTNTVIDFIAENPTLNGTMTQQLGYIEVPLEVNYALVDRKLGVNLIGGISSLFLTDNAVSLRSGELSTALGEANNVNTTNFSANMGLGATYKFGARIQLNLEPVFKYQLNTFSETDGTFKPYSIGIYSGLNFKF